MDRDLRRSAYVSGFVHVALIIAAIVTLPMTPLPTSSDADVEVSIVGLAPQKSPVKGTTPATAKADIVHKTEAQAENAPKPQTTEAPPPPPPPPPKSNAPVADKQTAQTAPPPPPQPSIAPSDVKPPPPAPPQKTPSVTQQKNKPSVKPPTSIKSATHQQHDVPKPQPLSQSVLSTLLNLKAQQKQKQPPKAVYNPDQNTAPDAGGSQNSTANSQLTGPDRAAIGAHMLPCWNYDGQAANVGSFQVLLQVTTDPTGTVRDAQVAPGNTGDTSNPIYLAFTQRALAAVTNYQCADLGKFLPPNLLGQNETFTFMYAPGGQ